MKDTTGVLRSWTGAETRDRTTDGSRSRVEALRAAPLGWRHVLVIVRLRGGDTENQLVLGTGSPRDRRLPAATVDGRGLAAGSSGTPRQLLAGVVRADPVDGAVGPLTLVNDTYRETFGADIEAHTTDLGTLLREELVGLDVGARARLVTLVSEAVRSDTDAGALSLARDLARVRDALREPAQVRLRGAYALQGVHIDAIHGIDEHGFWIRGWMIDRDAPVTRLTATSPEGHRAELLPGLYRFPRPDLEGVFGSAPPGLEDRDETGFVSYIELDGASRIPDGWIVEMENAVGVRTEAPAPDAIVDGLRVRNAILRDLAFERIGDHELKARHARRALQRLQGRLAGSARVERVSDHGRVPVDPAVSIIVPLYRRLDFLEQQLAHFVHDPDMRHAELVYVLDSPEQSEELGELAPALHDLYRVPFRVVYLERNLGFSGANNAGVAYARGERLLFLNSDIVPVDSGWLTGMLQAHDSAQGVGALGPKLLYEDDSLQHAGLYFQRQVTGLWENAHYYKGLHRALPAANVSRRVPAVTGACLLIDAGLYRDLGGFRGMYIQGDYEDSDLCLRVLEAGRANWYVPDVELYHLEGQSYPDDVRRNAGRYNLWLHTHLWDETIESIMSEPDFHDLRAPLGRSP